MDTSPAVSPPHGTASVHPIPAASSDPCHERTGSVDSAVLSISTANVEQNEKLIEFLFQIESWPKQMSYNRNNSVGALSMVKEEGESFRSVDTRHGAHQIPPVKKRSKSKTSSCLACIIYPLKKARDTYINCCFQFADAGDLAGLVGGGHTVGSTRNLFPVVREDLDQEELEKEIIVRRRRAAGKQFM